MPALRRTGYAAFRQNRGMRLAQFTAGINRAAQQGLPQVVREVQAYVVFFVYQGVVLRTPVLTGRARANWKVTMGKPSVQMVDPDQKVRQPGRWFGETGQPLTSKEMAEVLSRVQIVMKAPLGQRVFVSNRIGYIGFLEDGSSTKAPAGMVEVTLHSLSEGATLPLGIVQGVP